MTGDPIQHTRNVAGNWLYPTAPCPACQQAHYGWSYPVTYTFSSTPQRLSDEDIERIAKRLSELINSKPGRVSALPRRVSKAK